MDNTWKYDKLTKHEEVKKNLNKVMNEIFKIGLIKYWNKP